MLFIIFTFILSLIALPLARTINSTTNVTINRPNPLLAQDPRHRQQQCGQE